MRRLEAGMPQKGRAASTVSLPDMRRGRIALSSATLWARVGHPGSVADGVRTQDIAHAEARGQLAYYRLLERQGEARIIGDREALRRHVDEWRAWDARAAGAPPPLGFVVAIEGADPVTEPEEAALWWDLGVRIVSLAHYGLSAYAHGTGQPGPLTERGRRLLPALAGSGYLLDVTHLADESFFEALELFDGPVLASHSNCRALVPGDRQLTDEMIRLLAQRGAVIGAAMDAWMLRPGWVRGQTSNTVVSLTEYVDHIDHVCQVTGSSRHAAIGTDLDGGYGREQCPHDLDTIADLQRVPGMLRERGYADGDLEAIVFGNWLELLERAWA
jgi:membrane dipeptidase